MLREGSLEPQGSLWPPPLWRAVKDGDGRKPKLFVGPGEKLVLVTPCRRGLFIWRKFISRDGQRGVNCAVFRNEGAGLSVHLIRAADLVADKRWPGERHFTYVDPAATASRRSRHAQLGECFIRAGWQPCGTTKSNRLTILERPSQ